MSRNPNQRKIDMIETETACVLIEGPNCGDAGFFAGWLHAANEANEVLHRLMADPDADPRIQDVFMQYVPDFGWAACFFVRQLREKSCTFIVPWREELPELFCCLEFLGFFRLDVAHYQMAIPSRRADAAKVQQALLKLADTMDADCMLHPEQLVLALDKGTAKELQECLTPDDVNRPVHTRH
jgi:hypothetical protein